MDPRALLLLLLLLLAAAEPALTQSAADDAATAFGAAPSRPAAFHRAAKVSSGTEGGIGGLCGSPQPGECSCVSPSPQAAWRLPGRYVVLLRAGSGEAEVRGTARALRVRAARRGYPSELLHVFSLLPAFLVKMSSDVLDVV